MKKYHFLLCLIFMSFIFACATAGQKYISLYYTGDASDAQMGAIGISPVKDARSQVPKGYVGHRLLTDNSQETYFVNTMDLSESMTRAIMSFLDTKGYTPVLVNDWEPTPDGLAKANNGLPYLTTGTIDTFDCRAIKRGGHTSLTLEIKLTLYLGTVAENSVKTIPVSFSLEKKELTFTRDKLETFVNDSIAEILEKTLFSDG